MPGIRNWERWVELIHRGDLQQDMHCDLLRWFYWEVDKYWRQRAGNRPLREDEAKSLRQDVFLAIKLRGSDCPESGIATWIRGIVEDAVAAYLDRSA